MNILLNGDCLELMKTIEDKSVDLIFCDLPYNQTSCKWDQAVIDLDKFWEQVMRIKKLNTPIFMTTTTKFGVSLINSAPKKCHFRYDIIWKKSSSCSFLLAKKMPLRIHEMIYVFYEKLPFYDLSSHTHKFIKSGKSNRKSDSCYGALDTESSSKYNPPLPNSVIKEEFNDKNIKIELENTIYGDFILDNQPTNKDGTRNKYRGELYTPPLPNTMLEIKSTRGKHQTEKPVELMEWIFKYYSKEGDTILDPTMGSLARI